MFTPNPFSPGKRLTRPDLFSGRKKQLRGAVSILVQAAAGNARHALITGERGIGKSSFSSQLQGIARGEEKYLSLVDATSTDLPYTFLAVEHIAQDGQGPRDIAAGLLKELEAAKGLARFAKYKLDFTIELGPLTTSVSRADDDPKDAVATLIDGIQEVANKVKGKVDGVILIVDEIDRIADSPGVSTFFKVATEKLSSRGIDNVSFLPIGLIGTLEKLRGEHASAGRVFRLVEVPLLGDDEGKELLDKALDSTGVSIDPKASAKIVNLAGGYPNTLHLIGEQAYELAVGDGEVITEDIVSRAVDEVVRGAAREDFDPRYLAIKGRSRNIIKYMSAQEGRDVQAANISRHLKVKPSDVSAYFDSLLKSDVIVRPESGVYRLREPLFREYLRYIDTSGDEPVQRRPQRRNRES